tara:strand:+ start:4208 stop:4450 length:243 start_codon:yes stop_codon:yes gene_type:complete
MKEIKAYKLSTGEIVESYEEALEFEKKQAISEDITNYLIELIIYNPHKQLSRTQRVDMSIFITTYSKDLYELLKKHYEKD